MSANGQIITIPRGLSVTAKLSLALAGVDRFDFTGITLSLWCKRFSWQSRAESFFSMVLGPELFVEEEETLENAAVIKLAFSSADTAAFPIGEHVWELWGASGADEAPIAFGGFSVSFGPSLAGSDFSSLFEVSIEQELPWLQQAEITFDAVTDLDAFLQAHGISILQYDQILTALGYTIPTADAALQSGELTGEKIYQAFQNL